MLAAASALMAWCGLEVGAGWQQQAIRANYTTTVSNSHAMCANAAGTGKLGVSRATAGPTPKREHRGPRFGASPSAPGPRWGWCLQRKPLYALPLLHTAAAAHARPHCEQ
jgi:hypothetical protein